MKTKRTFIIFFNTLYTVVVQYPFISIKCLFVHNELPEKSDQVFFKTFAHKTLKVTAFSKLLKQYRISERNWDFNVEKRRFPNEHGVQELLPSVRQTLANNSGLVV